MTSQLENAKQLLTRYGNKLDVVVAKLKEEKIESLQATEEEETDETNFDKIKRLEEAVEAVKAVSQQLEKNIEGFWYTSGQSSTLNTDGVADYFTWSQNCLVSALDYVVLLQARIRALRSFAINISVMQQHISTLPADSRTKALLHTKPLELPTIPVSKFGGSIWECDNFCELFNANVHAQNLSELFKFNYLLNASQGEALESNRKIHVTTGNYIKAVCFLQNRYGNSEALIQRLIDRLDQAKLRNPSVKDQPALFEQLQQTCYAVCGTDKLAIPLNGTLLYHKETHNSVFEFNEAGQRSNNLLNMPSDIHLPDFQPLLVVLQHHWKSFLIAGVAAVTAAGMTYLFGQHIIIGVLKMVFGAIIHWFQSCLYGWNRSVLRMAIVPERDGGHYRNPPKYCSGLGLEYGDAIVSSTYLITTTKFKLLPTTSVAAIATAVAFNLVISTPALKEHVQQVSRSAILGLIRNILVNS
ncbi:hypothetical protein OESDEN_03846 [Oesophagostomum dentatum]|uniref:Uncharacterized protein n=1 Tax=Oesophagostomum dentatum TaxID=61180 RepID=A0A0B1TK69_OESDE|nr:hypothetical protein OESDEN_03846 [Oesophagostomum dentatum]